MAMMTEYIATSLTIFNQEIERKQRKERILFIGGSLSIPRSYLKSMAPTICLSVFEYIDTIDHISTCLIILLYRQSFLSSYYHSFH